MTKLFQRIHRPIVFLVVALLTSCFETEQEFTLNPDGSGKVVHESKFQSFDMNINFGGEELNEDEKLKQAVANIIEKSKGVDAWDDVHFERLDDGRILFRGTAWFPDLSKLKIENQMLFDFAWTRDPSGNGELALSSENMEKGEDQEIPPPDDKEGRRAWLAAERGKFQQARLMMAPMLTGMSHTSTFRLPGDALESRQFDDVGDGRMKIAIKGEKLLSSLDTMMADDEWVLEHGFSGGDSSEMPPAFFTAMFGGPEIPAATRTALDAPLFDYKAEVAAARANAEALAEKIGSAAGRVLPPSEGGPLKNVRLVGVRLGAEVDSALKLRPFNQNPGLALSVLCEFDGAILSIDGNKSAVETAVTQEGVSVVPKSDFQRRLNFSNLSDDNTHAIFNVNLVTPPAGATSLRDVAGTIHYSVAGETKEIDLGIAKIEKEQRGDEFGAEITDIKPGWREDGPLDLSLRLNLDKDELIQAWLVHDDRRSELDRGGYSSSNNVTTFTFRLPQDYEEESRIVVEIHDEIRTFTTPFILRDIPIPSLGGE